MLGIFNEVPNIGCLTLKILRLQLKNFNTEKKSNRDSNIPCKLLK